MTLQWRYYSLYGLSIKSSAPIHGLGEVEHAGEADLMLFDEQMPSGLEPDSLRWRGLESIALAPDASSVLHPLQQFLESDDGQYLQWRYGEHMTLVFSIDGREFYTRWSRDIDPAVRAFNIFGPGLGLVLRLRGIPTLHASVVDIDGRCIAIAGPSGAGKSTLAAAFELIGVKIRSDDLCVLHQHGGQFTIPQGPPRVRLLPDAAHALYGADGVFAPSPDGVKVEHTVHWVNVGTLDESVPLAGVYLLTGREDEWRISPLGGTTALFSLLRTLYLRYLTNAMIRQREFRSIDLLMRNVPLFQLATPDGHHKLTKLCREIVSRHSL